MSAWPPEAIAFLREQLPALRVAWERCSARPAALVAIHPERDRETLPAALLDAPIASALPAARVWVLARLVVPELAARLGESPGVGEVWCLVIGPTSAGVIPVRWRDGGERILG